MRALFRDMFDTSFLDKYTGKTEDKEEVLAFFPEDVPKETPYRETAITVARQIIDELNNLTYDGKTEEDVRAIFQAVEFFAGAVTFEWNWNTGEDNDGDGEM